MSKKTLVLLSILFLSFAVSSVNAYWTDLIPPPPSLVNTPIQNGDWITYKADVGMEGLTLSEIYQQFSNESVPPEIYLFEAQLNDTIDIIEQIELKITVMHRTNTSIILNIFFYYNDTMNSNYDVPAISLSGGDWSNTIFPYLRPANDSHTSILSYIAPVVNNFTQTFESTYPGLDVSSWFSITTTELVKYYAGAKRVVNELKITVPHIKQNLQEAINYFNVTLTPQQQSLWNSLPELDLEFYTHWDKEYGIFLGQKFSARFSTSSWFAYRAFQVYASATSLWEPNLLDTGENLIGSFFLGYGEQLGTYFVEATLFQSTESLFWLIVYIAVPVVIVSVLLYILFGRKKSKVGGN